MLQGKRKIIGSLIMQVTMWALRRGDKALGATPEHVHVPFL